MLSPPGCVVAKDPNAGTARGEWFSMSCVLQYFTHCHVCSWTYPREAGQCIKLSFRWVPAMPHLSLPTLRVAGPQLWAMARVPRTRTLCPRSKGGQRQISYEMPWWRQNFLSGKFTVLGESTWDVPYGIPGSSGLSFQPAWVAAAVLTVPAAPAPNREAPKPWPSPWWRNTVQVKF